jgi:hypothetical protein
MAYEASRKSSVATLRSVSVEILFQPLGPIYRSFEFKITGRLKERGRLRNLGFRSLLYGKTKSRVGRKGNRAFGSENLTVEGCV